jgi:hypothetical protein
MYSADKTIIWQKWQDPFGEKDDNIDLDSEYNNFFDDEDSDDNEEHEEISELKKTFKNNKHIKVIATPMGIVPINENTASGKIFNFWVGHTNFNITKYIADIIEKTEGVETLDIFTRYRFRIAIGKAFADSLVMKNIQEAIYSFMDTNEDDQKE